MQGCRRGKGLYPRFLTPERAISNYCELIIFFNFVSQVKPEGSASEHFDKRIMKTGLGLKAG